MANGETVHLQQASQPACPDIPLAESGRKRTPWHLLWENIPEEINPAYIADLHRISEAFAAPLANLFAFAKQGHQLCSFIPQKQLALYANPLFWQYGLFAFVSRCCSHNNQHRRQNASAAKAALTKHEESGEKDVDALTFMQTVIMSFVRGMEYGDQTLPINDLFVDFPVQLVPALVTAMEQQRFTPVGVKGGCGYRPRKQGEEDNPLLVVGVYNKEIAYDRYPECRTRPGRREHTPAAPLTHLWGKLCLSHPSCN